jgi:predicted transcriptional regulator of viral defense system
MIVYNTYILYKDFAMRRDPQDNAQKLYEVASIQGGYFTSAQALAAGYSYFQQHYHTQRGSWIRVERGIYRLRDYPSAEREDLIRLTLWSHNRKGKPQAVVSHETALSIHEMSDIMPSKVHLTVPKQGFRKPPPVGVVLHAARLEEDDVEQRPGFLVTTPLRTLLDVAASPLSQEHINQAVKDAIDKGLIRRRLLAGSEWPAEIHIRIDRALAAYGADSE